MSSNDPTLRFPPESPGATEGVADLERRVLALEEKVEKRGYDTRPIYEKHENDISELQKDVATLKELVDELLSRKTISKEQVLVFRDGMYYAEGDDIPWCAQCYETNGLRRHLTPQSTHGEYQCSNCDRFFESQARQPEEW